MQNHYNLLYREDEQELIPVCRQYGVLQIIDRVDEVASRNGVTMTEVSLT